MKVHLSRTPNHPDMENKQNWEYLEIHKNRSEELIVVHNVVLLRVQDEQSLFHQTQIKHWRSEAWARVILEELEPGVKLGFSSRCFNGLKKRLHLIN